MQPAACRLVELRGAYAPADVRAFQEVQRLPILQSVLDALPARAQDGGAAGAAALRGVETQAAGPSGANSGRSRLVHQAPGSGAELAAAAPADSSSGGRAGGDPRAGASAADGGKPARPSADAASPTAAPAASRAARSAPSELWARCASPPDMVEPSCSAPHTLQRRDGRQDGRAPQQVGC